ncbi:MAG TPA: sugar transferase [Oligoflexia bacterium]|nr:sugar transferase [Oligoflexia bacterium]
MAVSRNSAAQSAPLGLGFNCSPVLPLELGREKVPHVAFACFKRLFDVAASLALLSMLGPFMILISLIIRLSSSGPAIYCQKRLTEGGRVFTMFKFRTMVAHAEQDGKAVWACSSDPRVTRLGRFLRQTRLDELPQLINILMGDMSLIGPRPERPEIASQLVREFPAFNKRLRVKAGLTGLAQVQNGYAASTETYRKKLAWDILYIKKRSIFLEISIAAKTFLVVLTGDGAR